MEKRADGITTGEGKDTASPIFTAASGTVCLAASAPASGLPLYSRAELDRQLAQAPALLRRAFASGRRSAATFAVESVNRVYIRLAGGR